jgi:GDPmannose 4,6-dehydratase
MWKMLQQNQGEDYIIATGTAHTVRELVEHAFSAVELDWRRYVVVDPALLRPAEVDHLIGDASKAKKKLGWEPLVSFAEMIQRMVEHDLKRVEREY